MSWCFPYPPPGFNGKTAINEALIQSIKLQKDSEKATTESRKEKKREKKAKRKETKENKETSILTSTGITHEEYAHKGEQTWIELKGGDPNKRKQEDADQLERSGITEEHGQALSLQNSSNSSDSTQNSNKRRKQASPVDVNDSCEHAGNIIRIRMPLQKHKEHGIPARKEQLSSSLGRKGQHKVSDVSASKEQICSTSGSKDLLGHCGHEVGRRTSQDDICSSLGTIDVDQGLSFGSGKELSCSTSGWTEGLALDDNRATSGFRSGTVSRENKMQKLNLYTEILIQNLVPMALPNELSNVDDDEWLFGKKHSDGAGEKRFKARGDVSCCGSSAAWPNAQYLRYMHYSMLSLSDLFMLFDFSSSDSCLPGNCCRAPPTNGYMPIWVASSRMSMYDGFWFCLFTVVRSCQDGYISVIFHGFICPPKCFCDLFMNKF